MILIQNITENVSLRKKAIDLVLTREENNILLLEKLLLGEEKIIAAVDNSKEILAVFFYDKNGMLIPFFKTNSMKICEEAKKYFLDKKIFVITGEDQSVTKMYEILYEKLKEKQTDDRSLFLMQKKSLEEDFVLSEQFTCCTKKDVDSIMPLQCGFMKEESLPNFYTELYLPKVRMNLDAKVKEKKIFILKNEKEEIVSKLNLSGESKSCILIGGVYTKKEFRNKGYGKKIILNICKKIFDENKKPVLFVRKANTNAIHCYLNTGFEVCGDYRMIYFKQ